MWVSGRSMTLNMCMHYAGLLRRSEQEARARTASGGGVSGGVSGVSGGVSGGVNGVNGGNHNGGVNGVSGMNGGNHNDGNGGHGGNRNEQYLLINGIVLVQVGAFSLSHFRASSPSASRARRRSTTTATSTSRCSTNSATANAPTAPVTALRPSAATWPPRR